MANIQGQKKWSDVRLLETHELARGGVNGNLNEQAKALADRTKFLMDEKASKAEIVQGVFEFGTYAEFDAYKTNLPLRCTVIIGEENTTGIGTWGLGNNRWNGSVLEKSPHDPLTQAKADATTKANTAKSEAITKAVTLSSIGEWLTEDGKTTLSTLNISNTADANKLKVIRTIEKIALLNASSSERFYIQSVLRNQGANGSRIHVQRESQLGTKNRVASLIIADTVTTAGVQEYTVDVTDGIKLKILVNWDNFETNTSALNVNLPINNLKFLKEFQVAEQITVAKAEAISAAATDATTKANTAEANAISASATDATSKASAAETNAKNHTDQFFNQFLINQGASWES